jgi:sugar phosphate permease
LDRAAAFGLATAFAGLAGFLAGTALADFLAGTAREAAAFAAGFFAVLPAFFDLDALVTLERS